MICEGCEGCSHTQQKPPKAFVQYRSSSCTDTFVDSPGAWKHPSHPSRVPPPLWTLPPREGEGDPAAWPAWTDASRLTIGPDLVHQALADIRHTAAYLGDDPPVKGHALEAAADVLEAALYEPTDQDWADFHAWCRERDERNQDLEDAYRESQYQDMLERSARLTDQDLTAAGLPVG
jgi:hypothetical protein